jgi:CheY-like chemotaxis protein/anti-sigma regulatory factor (Ser/Thr protein kinase)
MLLSAQTIEVRPLIRSVESMISTELQKKRLHFATDVAKDVQAIEADERKTKQILINLFTNAIKYAPAGSEIRVVCRRVTGTWVRFSVIDRGVGIAESERERIFDEFHQVDRKRDEAIGGIGLGLALCKRLVHLHGGEIGVESKVGEGSKFWFTLPGACEGLVIAFDGEDLDAKVTASNGENGLTMILVENDEASLALLTESLTPLGVHVFAAYSSDECVELTETHNPDIIVVNAQMPLMDGLEAIRRLRAMPAFRGKPIIALAGNASKLSLQQCLEAGCTDYVSKPVEPGRFIQVLGRYVALPETRGDEHAVMASAPRGLEHE